MSFPKLTLNGEFPPPHTLDFDIVCVEIGYKSGSKYKKKYK
jgi:hypothetical protein